MCVNKNEKDKRDRKIQEQKEIKLYGEREKWSGEGEKDSERTSMCACE